MRNGFSALAVGPGMPLWRVRWPIDALARQGFPASYYPQTNLGTALGQPCDVVLAAGRDDVWAESDNAARIVQALHDEGKVVVVDLDDDDLSSEVWPEAVAQNHCRRRTNIPDWTPGAWDFWQSTHIAALGMVDGITVSTPSLMEVAKRYTDRPVVVVPDVIDVGWWRAVMANARRHLRSPVIGWAGSCRSPEIVRPIAQAWVRLAGFYRDVTFLTVGCPNPAFDAEGMEALEGRLFHLDFVSSFQWPGAVAEMDIGCAAADDAYVGQRSKSAIKAWEYGLSGVPIVATEQLYGPEISGGTDGLLVRGPDDWLPLLELLLNDKPLRRRLVRARRRRVEQQHHLERSCWQWVLAWGAILEDAAQRGLTEIVQTTDSPELLTDSQTASESLRDAVLTT